MHSAPTTVVSPRSTFCPAVPGSTLCGSAAGLRPFGFFEFALIGLPLLAAGVAYSAYKTRGFRERPLSFDFQET